MRRSAARRRGRAGGAWLGACALSLAVLACGDLLGPRRDTFRGRYVHAFEASAFTKCGAGETWWATFEARHPALDSALAAEQRPQGQTEVYLVVRGRLSGLGRYGHLGGSRRELTVDEILEVRPWDPGACR